MAEQPPKQRGRDAKGRVGYHLEGLSRQTQVGRVRLNDEDRRSEAFAKPCRACGMKLHRDNPRTLVDQVRGDGPVTCADVEDQLAGTYSCRLDQPIRPGISELLIPPTRPPIRGHDAP